MAAIPELAQPLGDGTVTVRAGAERDIPEILIAYQDDRHLHERLGEDRPPSGAELGRRCEGAAEARARGVGVTLTVVEAGSDVCIGEVRVHSIEWLHDRAEVTIWLAPHVRGRGLGARALVLASSWLFGACGLERLTAFVEPENRPMVAAARRAGFAEEGVARGRTLRRSRRYDAAVLSLLAGDLAA